MPADSAELLRRLAERILGIERPHPLRVCVDGHSAAGKSTLCRALEERNLNAGRECLRVELDDFHPANYLSHPARFGTVQEYLEGGYDWDVVVRDVLEPAGPGGDRRIRRQYWDSFNDQAYPPGWTVLGEEAVLLVDGVFAQLPRLVEHWDLTIWLEVDFETVLSRAVVRDLEWGGGTADGVRRGYEERWIPRHQYYAETYDPLARSDVAIDNRDPANPVILRW